MPGITGAREGVGKSLEVWAFKTGCFPLFAQAGNKEGGIPQSDMAGNSNSGRKALPAAVHMMRGNPSKKPIAELTSAGVEWELIKDMPECPRHLTEYAREEWDRIAPDLYMLGLINKLDQGELAVYCTAYGDWRHAREMMNRFVDSETGYVDVTPNGFKQQGVWMQIANRAEERMRTAGGSFGLNPSARSKINLPKAQGSLFPNDEQDVASKYGLN